MNRSNIIELEKDEAFLLGDLNKNKICPMKCHIPDKRIWWIPKKFIDSSIKNSYYINIDYSICHNCYIGKNLTSTKYNKDDFVPVLSCGLSFNCDEGEYNKSFKYDCFDMSIVDRNTMETMNSRVEGDTIIVGTNKNSLNILILMIYKLKDNKDNKDNNNIGDDIENENNKDILYTCLRKPNDISKFSEHGQFDNEFMITLDKYYSSNNKMNDIIIKFNNKEDSKLLYLDYFFSVGYDEEPIKNIKILFKKESNLEEKYKPKQNITI